MGLRGRIDRIDVQPATGRWAVLDYKTSDAEAQDQDPESRHRRRDGRWTDLQLPLYRLLVQPLADAEGWVQPPQLGYVVLPRDPLETDALLAGWDQAALDEAWAQARRVVRDVRAGRFAELGDFPDHDPIFAWIAGRGLLAADLAGDASDGSDGSDGGDGGDGEGGDGDGGASRSGDDS